MWVWLIFLCIKKITWNLFCSNFSKAKHQKYSNSIINIISVANIPGLTVAEVIDRKFANPKKKKPRLNKKEKKDTF